MAATLSEVISNVLITVIPWQSAKNYTRVKQKKVAIMDELYLSKCERGQNHDILQSTRIFAR